MGLQLHVLCPTRRPDFSEMRLPPCSNNGRAKWWGSSLLQKRIIRQNFTVNLVQKRQSEDCPPERDWFNQSVAAEGGLIVPFPHPFKSESESQGIICQHCIIGYIFQEWSLILLLSYWFSLAIIVNIGQGWRFEMHLLLNLAAHSSLESINQGLTPCQSFKKWNLGIIKVKVKVHNSQESLKLSALLFLPSCQKEVG